MSYVGKVSSGGADHLVASSLYGVCSTSANTAAKIVSLSDFDALITGITIQVKFQYSNTADAPTLNVNGTGAYPIYTDSTNYPGNTRLTSWYPNAVVGLTFDGTAWRMNDVDINAANGLSDLLNMIYPVGAIYLSVNATSPATLFGGTWERIQDRFLLAAGSSHGAGTTGGAETVTLDTSQIPGHTHSVPAHAHGLNNHVHSVGAHAHGLNGHTHSVPAHAHGMGGHVHSVGAHSHGLNNHVHSVGAHSHGLNGHTHGIPALSGSTGGAGAHGHRAVFAPPASGHQQTSFGYKFEYPGSISYTPGLDSSGIEEVGDHAHSVSTNASTTGGPSTSSTANSGAFNTGAASGSTANSGTFNTGAPSTANTANSSVLTSGAPSTANTANSTAFNTGACATNTANSSVLTSGSTGGGQAHTNMPPFLSVYCWKRTA